MAGVSSKKMGIGGTVVGKWSKGVTIERKSGQKHLQALQKQWQSSGGAAMVNSKQKGKRGEVELTHKLNDYGFDTRRSVQYNGKADDGQADLLGLPGIHIESKRVEKLNLYDAMAQAIHDAKDGELPTVFHRKNHCEWLVSMRLDDWIKLYKEYFETVVEK